MFRNCYRGMLCVPLLKLIDVTCLIAWVRYCGNMMIAGLRLRGRLVTTMDDGKLHTTWLGALLKR